MKTYEAGTALLIERLRRMHRADWSPTPERKAAEAIAAKLDELANLLDEQGVVQTDVEQFHDRSPQPQIGPDGLPEPIDNWSCSYKATIGHMRDLAASARRVASDLPDPRKKHALPFAALALLHLRYEHGYPRPALQDNSDDVRELQRVTTSASIVLSPTTLRTALADALREFDPTFVPSYIADLIR